MTFDEIDKLKLTGLSKQDMEALRMLLLDESRAIIPMANAISNTLQVYSRITYPDTELDVTHLSRYIRGDVSWLPLPVNVVGIALAILNEIDEQNEWADCVASGQDPTYLIEEGSRPTEFGLPK